MVAILDKASPEIIGGKHTNKQHKHDEGDDPEAGEIQPQELPGQIAQHAVDNAEQGGQDIIGRPDWNDYEQADYEIFFEEIFDFFHNVYITDFTGMLQAFFVMSVAEWLL